MMTLVAMAVFLGAMTLALAAIWSTVAPEWRRIARVAGGRAEGPFQPLSDITSAGRRVAVRRWVPAPVRASSHRQRAA